MAEGYNNKSDDFFPVLSDFINILTAVEGNFDALFLGMAQLFRAVLGYSDNGFSVFLFDKFINEKLNHEYSEPSGISPGGLKSVLEKTIQLLIDRHVDKPVIFPRSDINEGGLTFVFSALVVPIRTDTVVSGYAVVYCFDRRETYSLDSPQVLFLAVAMRLASLAVQMEQKNVMARHYFLNDYLTGLPNRDYIYEMIIYSLQTSEIYETRFALLIIRLNGLKNINNSLGIFTGDTLIKEIGTLMKAAVLSSAAPFNPFVGRLGGADFAVLLTLQNPEQENPDIKQDEEVLRICCEAIIKKTQENIEINGYNLYPSINIGASIYPFHGATAEEMLRKADLAKSAAKQNKPNSFQMYDFLMDGDLERTMFLNNNLPVAIASNQFELYYQGQMNIETGLIIGAEALIRWLHPEKGLIFPGYFIEYAENNEFSIPIDLLVLKMACEQINKWRDKGFDLLISVNISPKHFANGLIYDSVTKALKSYDVDPRLLKIELLESALLENFDVTIRVINDLRKMGVTVALDDFGAGYSSLEYVAKLPLDFLKIDRGFSMHLKENPSNEVILETIVTLAKGMKVKTIVEGVESQFQYDFLKKIGCDLAQGYFINKPLPVDKFEQLLEENKA
jgi:diguanylate cyclase (GGDEF)-like protein